MKTGKTLSQLAAEIERQHETKRDYVANLDAVTMVAQGGEPRLAVEGTGNFGVTEIAHNQIAGPPLPTCRLHSHHRAGGSANAAARSPL